MSRIQGPAPSFEKAQVVEAYDLATQTDNSHGFVVVRNMVGPSARAALLQVKHPNLPRINEIMFNEVPNLPEAFARAVANIAAQGLGDVVTLEEPPFTHDYEQFPRTIGEGYDEYRLDNRGVIEVMTGLTALCLPMQINAVRYPIAITPQQLRDDQDTVEVDLLDFREEQRRDHTSMEDSLVVLEEGGHAITPSILKPSMYHAGPGSADQAILRHILYAYDAKEGTLEEALASNYIGFHNRAL